MTRLIDADALIKTLNEKNIPVDVRVNYEIMNAPTIEPDSDTISRSQAIKDISEWATDILHPDRLVKEDAIHILESLPSAETPTISKKHQLSEETSTNTSTDLISRQDAVNEIHKYFVEEIEKTPTEIDEDGDELYADMPTVNSLLACNKELSKRIKSLPSAPDSRQRGEWVDRSEGGRILHPWWESRECDQCGDFGSLAWNFCPNCGADMRGGEEDGKKKYL